MRKLFFIVLCIFSVLFVSCTGKSQKSIVSNNIRNYLIHEAAEISDHSLSGVHTLKDWQSIRDRRYSEFIEMMGISDMPLHGPRSPLNIKITGTIQQKGYHIEKLYYESLPGLYVRANLYVPDSINKPLPAILYVCGHSPTQKVHYQAHPAKFARLGFVCLIIETIQFGEVQGEHWGCYARGWFNWYSRGYNPAGVELWNAIRGIDLLISRPEVDAEKIGVTGISGGGSQSWYIAAADSRIKAVAPVCGASTLKAQVACRTIDGHCDCMMPQNTYQQDFTDIGALIAPRPLLICQADRDGVNQVESVQDLYSQVANIYKLYQAGDQVGLVVTPGGHSYHKISRERIFSFFIRNLTGRNITPEEAGDIDNHELSENDLRVFIDGEPKDDRNNTIQDSFVRLAGAPDIASEEARVSLKDTVKKFLELKTFGAFPKKAPEFEKQLEFRTLDGGRFGEEIFSFIPEEGWRLKVDIHWEHKADSANPLLIVLRNYDDERWASEGFASAIAGARNVAFFETRGIGEFGWAPELQWHVRRAAAWTGRTVASMQVYDLLRCIEFCRSLPGVDPAKVSIAARNEMGVVALYAALMDGKCESVIVKDPPASQDMASDPGGKGPATEMLNCLRITDVYQLPALLSPTRTIFAGEIPLSYRWSEKVLEKTGNGTFLSIQTN